MEYASGNPAVPSGSAVFRGTSTGSAEAHLSTRTLLLALRARLRMFLAIVGLALILCLVYCLFAPKTFEARARVAMRSTSEVPLNLSSSQDSHTVSAMMGQTELETLASKLRSDDLAWRVIREEKLYTQTAFAGTFAFRFKNFSPDAPDPGAQAWLLERFCRRLKAETIPRTLVVEVRFRSQDAALSARVVNALLRAYDERESESRVNATAQATHWLYEQLAALKESVDSDDVKLADFQRAHKLIFAPVSGANGMTDQVQHSSIVQGIDTLGQQLVDASAEQILRKAQYKAAVKGDPELVIASDPRLAGDSAGLGVSILHQLHTQRSALEQEQAQLNLEHGPNFPRSVEVRSQLIDLDRQIKAEKDRIISRLRASMLAAQNRESMLHASLQTSTSAGLEQNQAAAQFAVMRQEAASRRAVYLEVLQKAREAGMQAGIEQSNLAVIDSAHQPAQPVSPNPRVDFALTLFISFWIALAAVLIAESLHPAAARSMVVLLAVSSAIALHAQAPTPSTSGLPTGVARIPQSSDNRTPANQQDAPAVWQPPGTPESRPPQNSSSPAEALSPAPLAPGDMIAVSEAHEPTMHATARVAEDGTVTLPLAGVVKVSGMDEAAAAHAIESALLAAGMLLHPQVTVLVTSYVGQDVSVLGEVARPGIYPYMAHHRLLDFIAAAQGLSPNAGSLATVTPRDAGMKPFAVMLHDVDAAGDHNPDLLPGDTLQIRKAGLVYVVGDVMRPGGFAVDPSQQLTVVQALTLAWGPTHNAALGEALLICDKRGGRMVTHLDLKRMLRGKDPDLPIHDRDILFVPDSFARNLMNRTMESVVQSAAGVSIYAGLVYSQRF